MIDPASLILEALKSGALIVGGKAASEATKDAYDHLKDLIRRKIGAKTLETGAPTKPTEWEVLIDQHQLSSDAQIVDAARAVLALEGQSDKTHYNVELAGRIEGSVVGSHNTVTMTFDKRVDRD
jgi:hypothetical protein